VVSGTHGVNSGAPILVGVIQAPRGWILTHVARIHAPMGWIQATKAGRGGHTALLTPSARSLTRFTHPRRSHTVSTPSHHQLEGVHMRRLYTSDKLVQATRDGKQKGYQNTCSRARANIRASCMGRFLLVFASIHCINLSSFPCRLTLVMY
jgi:hypothetical protein